MEVVNGTASELEASCEGVTAESDPEPRIPSEEEHLKSLSSTTPDKMTHVDTGPKEAVEHPELPKEAASAPHLPDHQTDPSNGPVATTIDPTNGLVASKADSSNDLAATKNSTSGPTNQKREDGVSSPKETKQDPNATPTVTKDAGGTVISTVVRKNIPPKRDRMEPLKLDMSKPTVMPLTSSQLSLQCLECHIIFSDDKSKRRHLKMSHPAEYEQCMLGDALFACYVCDRHFANSVDLMAHQRTHTERKPFTCILCGEAFKRLSHLTMHKKVHCTSEGYTCSDCGRSFKTLTLLKYHSRTHTGEKPYVCKECGKRFSMPKALQKHLQTHNPDEGEENSNNAILAPKAKKQKSNEPSERKFRCPHCKARFKTEKNQHHHIKRKHAANRNAPACRALATQLPQNQGPPLLTQAAIGQSQVLRLDSGGQAPQCIEPEQIKRLIESLGNVQKVNQLVIYGLEPVSHQSQTLNLQPVPGVVQPIRFDLPHTGSPKLVADGSKPLNSEQAKQQVNPTTAPMLNGGVGKTNACSSAENTQSSERILGHTGTVCSVPLQAQGTQFPVGEDTAVTMEETCAAVKSISVNEADEMTSGSKSAETLQETGQNHTLQLQHSSSLIPTNELEADGGVSMVFIQEEEVQMQSMSPSDAFSLVATDSSQQTGGQIVNLTPEGTQSITLARVTSQKKSKKNAGLIVTEVGQPLLGTFVQPKDHMGHTALKTSQSNSEVHAIEETSGQTLPPSHESNGGGVTTNVAKQLKAKKGRPAKKKSNKTQAKKSVHNALLKQKNEIQDTQQRNTESHPPLHVVTFATQEEAQTKGHVLVKFGLGGKNEKLSKKDKTSKKGKDGKLQEKELHHQSHKGEEGKGKPVKTHGKKKTPAEILTKPQNQQQNVLHLEEVKSKVKSRKRKSKTQSKESKGMAVKEGSIAPSPKKKKQEQIIMPKSIEQTSEVEVTEEDDFKQNSKGVPVAISSDPMKSDVLLLLKGHKQPQLKVHKLDAPQNLSQPDQVPSHTTSDSMTLNEETKTARVKHAEDHKKTMSKNLKRQSSTDHLGSSVRKKAKVGRKKKPTKPVVAASPPLLCDNTSKYSEEPVSRESNSCEPQKEFVGHDTSTPVRTPLTKEIIPRNLVSPKTFELQVTSDWDAEMEMRELGLGDREDQRVSFPALNPSPSLPHVPTLAEGEQEEVRKDGNSGMTGDSLEAVPSPSEGMKSSQSATCPESTPVRQTPSQLSSTSLSESTHVTAPKVSSAKSKNNKRRKTKKKLSETGDKMSKVQDSSDAIQTPCEPDMIVDEDSKEDLPLDVNLVTVEEETRPMSPLDEEPPESPQKHILIVSDGQSKLSSHDDKESNHERVPPEKNCERVVKGNSTETSAENDSSNPPQIKEEDAEKAVHAEERKCESNRSSTARGRKKGGGGGRGRRGNSKKRNTGNRSSTEHEPLRNDKDECQIVYQLYSVAGDSGVTKSQEGKGSQVCPNPPSLSDPAESQEDNSEEQVVFELESVTTSVVDMVKSEAEQGGQDRTEGSSPGLLLEKFLTSRGNGSGESAACDQVVADATNAQNSGDNVYHRASTLPPIGQPGAISIKEEEFSQPVMPPVLLPETAETRGPLISNLLPVEEQQQGVQMFVVKEEDPLILNDPQGSQDSQHGKRKDGPLPTSSAMAASEPPVEVERNMSGIQLGMVPSPIHQPSAKQCIFFPVKEEDRELLLDSPSRSESQNSSRLEECDDICEISQPDAQCVDSGFIDEDERGSVEHSTADLVEFLSQSSDTENSEFFDNDPVAETLALACYYGNRSSGSANLPAGSSNLPGDRTSQLSQNDGSSSQGCQRKPIDYFTQYFNWKTWQDVANVTAKTSKMPIAVTAKEVSQFVGIHIAMGSLQFPSTKLYWDEFTRVPLIADAMPSSRFLELLSKLRLAAAEEPSPASAQGSGNTTTETCSTQPDPLHRVRTLVEKVQRGCRNLKREVNHGVSQYPLELLRSTAKSPYSLHHTVMLSTAGLVVDFNLSLDDSDREDTVKKMVLSSDKSADGMVFLCKPELSIPSMLEQLLDAGVQSAGKVGGARGQVGDEFVSSDGKLKLFRCHHGFILSAAAKGRSRSTSLVSGFERAIRAAKLNRDLRSSYRTPCLGTSPGAWPLSVLWHLTDLALVNSWLEHQSDHNSKQAPLSLLAFRLEVSKALIMSSSADAQDATPPQPPAPQRPEQDSFPGSPSIFEAPLPDSAVRYDGLGHWPEQVAEGEGARCRFGGCDRTSQVRCLKCCVFLCISRHHNCFLKFHSQGAV